MISFTNEICFILIDLVVDLFQILYIKCVQFDILRRDWLVRKN